jgi:hypothetical protein
VLQGKPTRRKRPADSAGRGRFVRQNYYIVRQRRVSFHTDNDGSSKGSRAGSGAYRPIGDTVCNALGRKAGVAASAAIAS